MIIKNQQTITPLENRLLNDYQHHFPLNSTPFSQIAQDLQTNTKTILKILKKFKKNGTVSRVGPVFRPNRIGISTLAAISVPKNELEKIADLINQYPEVNHNYERDHKVNLWFVVTSENKKKLQQVLDGIQEKTGYKVISLPLIKEYHIDLGFRFKAKNISKISESVKEPSMTAENAQFRKLRQPYKYQSKQLDTDLIKAIQLGFPLTERPYFKISQQIGITEEQVIQRIATMQLEGTIKRLGVVVRHHELGYQANAMLVWDIPDKKIDQIAHQLSVVNCVTLCYQRPRVLPHWNYNLFTMIHGKNRNNVLSCINDIIDKLQLIDIPHQILFSKRRFKQRGACYRGN